MFRSIKHKTKKWFVVGEMEERMLVQWLTAIMITVHWGLGLAILVGGKQRFSLPTYKPLIEIVNGHTWIWGAVAMFAAVLMMSPFKWPNIFGFWLGMCWMIIWMSLFAVSVLTFPTAAATAMVAYAGFAMIDAALLTARVLDQKRE